jgi:hypothetical protein
MCGKTVLEREAINLFPGITGPRFCSKECRTKFAARDEKVGVIVHAQGFFEIYIQIFYARASIRIPLEYLETTIQCLQLLESGKDSVKIDPIAVARFKEEREYCYICFQPPNWHVAFHELWIPILLRKLQQILTEIRLEDEEITIETLLAQV